MKFATLDDIQEAGFEGFVAIKDLQTREQRRIIPDKLGVYMILRLSRAEPVFNPLGSAYGRTIKSPYSLEVLQARWQPVASSIVIYIGKAGGQDNKGANLRKRLSQYLRLSHNHSGGRAIWQLNDCGELLVCWKTLDGDSPRAVEARLVAEFKSVYGAYPFANRAA